jgi:hypothetical protein
MRCSKQQLYPITSLATESSPSSISMGARGFHADDELEILSTAAPGKS